MHFSQIGLPVENSFGRAQQMAFQMRDAHMGCEGYNGFQTSMSVSLANDIALKRWIFFLCRLKVVSTCKERHICLIWIGSKSVWTHQIVCVS